MHRGTVLLATAAVCAALAVSYHGRQLQRVRAAGIISIAELNAAHLTDFNTLAVRGTDNTALPEGWELAESGGGARDNEQYAADSGTSNAGDVYSYGNGEEPERALGMLRSGTLIPTIGAAYQNNTGRAVRQITISYTGEHWRLGATTARPDRIDFQYSLNATSITDSNATWTDVNGLDFESPVTSGTVGALNGNAAPNRTAKSFTISGLNVSNGGAIYIRFTDFDPAGADDGLAIDDFSMTLLGEGGGTGGPTLGINDVSIAEGNAGTQTMNFTVSIAPVAASAVSFDFATANGTATAPEDYIATNGSRTIGAGVASATISVEIKGDTDFEPDETFFVNITNVSGAAAGDTQGLGTIQNDDVRFTRIHTIQGRGSASPLAGQVVSTEGVVTAVVSNGYFIQTPDELQDGAPETSEGIFVFTGAAGAKPSRGNLVRVTGPVTEFIDANDVVGAPLTEFGGGSTFSVLAASQPMPVPILVTHDDLHPDSAYDEGDRLERLERLEGMRVVFPPIRSVTGTYRPNNNFFAVLSTYSGAPFREEGIERNVVKPAGLPFAVPRWDTNPEVFSVDIDGQAGVTAFDVPNNTAFPSFTGVLTSVDRKYTVLPDVGALSAPAGTAPPGRGVRMPTPNEFTVATMNLERYGDEPEFVRDKIAQAIVKSLRMPDIIAVQESSSLELLQSIAAKVNELARPGSPTYRAHLIPSPNDTIHNGFLVRADRVWNASVRLAGVNETVPGGTDLNDRPPLILEAAVVRIGGDRIVRVIGNHLRSLLSVDYNNASGDAARIKRQLQAEYLANLVQANLDSNLIVLGDMNAFQFNDGYVDVLNTVRGVPAPFGTVLLPSADVWPFELRNVLLDVPAGERFSYIFRGTRQLIDHILVNSRVEPWWSGTQIAHHNAEYSSALKQDATRFERFADHDNPVAYFLVTDPQQIAGGFTVSFSDYVLDPATREHRTVAMVTNTGSSAWDGPVQLLLDSLAPGVTLVNATSEFRSKPYVNINSLAAGASVSIPLTFKSPGNAPITFQAQLWRGLY